MTPGSSAEDPLGHLGPQERAVLFALAECGGRVVSRRELARRVGITDLSERRCDSLLVGVRRLLGPGAIRTVRSRGWMLEPGGSRAGNGIVRSVRPNRDGASNSPVLERLSTRG